VGGDSRTSTHRRAPAIDLDAHADFVHAGRGWAVVALIEEIGVDLLHREAELVLEVVVLRRMISPSAGSERTTGAA
jgi:hypothetical protein